MIWINTITGARYAVYEVDSSKVDAVLFKRIQIELGARIDMWKEAQGAANPFAHWMIAGEKRAAFEHLMRSIGVSVAVRIEDVGALVRHQLELNVKVGCVINNWLA